MLNLSVKMARSLALFCSFLVKEFTGCVATLVGNMFHIFRHRIWNFAGDLSYFSSLT